MVQRWYVASVRLGFEDRAEANLVRQGFYVWTPRQVRVVRHARRRQEKSVPFFPGYVFLRLDIDRQRWRSVNGTLGVRSLIMTGERPLPCPEGLVEGLQALTDRNGTFSSAARMESGDAIRVVAGPLAEVVGTLLHLDGAGRARVLVKLLRSELVVTLDANRLAPAAA
jgi:transcription antitermination factor NusG